ncbi:hypothetical protein CcaverHIS641_0310120 [Cutaneotrichosporon cavernicola]|nr:hypothetical protein CcaverHIS641_0310120 [Cutaneotrichosporon cavernicola]
MQSSGSYPHFDGALPSNTRDSHPAGSLLYNMQNLPSSGTDHLTIIPIPPSARLGNPRQPIHTPIYLHDPLLPIQAHSHPYGPKLPMANPWPENSQLATPPYSNFSTATSSVSTPGQATPEEQSQEALREHWRCWVRARSTLSCVFEMLPSVPLRNRPFITKLYGGLMRTLRQLDLGGWAEATQPEGCVTPPAHPPTLKATVEAAIQQVKALQETAGAAQA